MTDIDHPVGAREGRPSVEALGTIGVICFGWFLVTVVVLHLVQPDLGPVDHQISEYVLGSWGWLMTTGFVVVGVGIVAMGLGLRRSLTPGRRVWAAWLIVLTGVFFLGVAAFPTDAPLADGTTANTLSGQTHAFASTVGVLVLAVGAFVLRGVFTRDDRWRPLARLTGWFAVAMTLWFLVAGAVVVAFGQGTYGGVVQRLFWLVMAGWFVLIGLWMRRVGAAPSATPVAPR